MTPAGQRPRGAVRSWIARSYTWVEDLVYISLGLLLSITVLVLVASGFLSLGRGLAAWELAGGIIGLLDQILLILLLVELLYTVQVSFREHALSAEPFLLVGLIATIRRVLVLTAELGEQKEPPSTPFLVELGVLALLILVLAMSLLLLRKHGPVAERG